MRSNGVIRSLFKTSLPGGAVLAVAALAAYSGLARSQLPDVLAVASVCILALGLFLGWRFHRAKVVFVLLALALALGGLVLAEGEDTRAQLVFAAVALLLPADFALFSLLPERGLVSVSGLRRLALLVAQSAAVLAVGRWGGASALRLLEFRFSSSPIFERTGVPQPALAVFLLALVALAVGLALRRSTVEAGLLWSLAAAFLALDPGAPGPLAALYITAAELILALSVVEISHSLAFRDELTGLPGRRALNESLAQLRGRYSIAMVDVDHFKRLNDRFGHDAGDQVLRMIAARLADCGGGAKGHRFGGEEFALVFPGRSTAEALPHLERLRAAVAGSPFAIRRPGRSGSGPDGRQGLPPEALVRVTISIGVAEHFGRDGSAEAVLRAADKALYGAKRHGRNRVAT